MRTLLATNLFAAWAFGQGIITTIAGTDYQLLLGKMDARSAPIVQVWSMSSDAQGNVYLADYPRTQVLRLSPEGSLSVFAGNGIKGYSGDDGLAARASIDSPVGVAMDARGFLLIVDRSGRIRCVDPSGTIYPSKGPCDPANRTKTGSGWSAFGTGHILDHEGNVVYLGDSPQVLKLAPDGSKVVIAGNGKSGYAGDGGAAPAASLNVTDEGSPLAYDPAGNLYIADYNNHRVRKVSPDGTISTFAGTGATGFGGDGGPAASAIVASPRALAWSDSGLLISDGSYRIRRVGLDGTITTVAGNGERGSSGDGGPATAARIDIVYSILAREDGSFLLAGERDGLIRRVTRQGIITTAAGNGHYGFGGDGVPAVDTYLNRPEDVAVAPNGDVFIADTGNNRIRRISGGVITTVAGTGAYGYSGDGGPATQAALAAPGAVAVDREGNLFIADPANRLVRKVTPDGIINTLVRNGDDKSGPCISPLGLTFDSSGNLVIANGSCGTVVRLLPDGAVQKIVGPLLPGVRSARPSDAAYDPAGNLYFTDTHLGRILRAGPDGSVSVVVGTPSSFAIFQSPRGLAVDANGGVYVSEACLVLNQTFSLGCPVRRVSPDGKKTTVAGAIYIGFCCDGLLSTEAGLDAPHGLAFDRDGNLLIADTNNNRIRKILAAPPEFTATADPLDFAAASGGAPTEAVHATVASSVPGVRFAVTIQYRNGEGWLNLSTTGGGTPQRLDLTADAGNLEPGEYEATVVFSPVDFAAPAISFPAHLTVTAAAPPHLAADLTSISFTLPKGVTSQSTTLIVRNAGGGSLDFRTAFLPGTGGAWLTVSSTSGTVTPRTPAAISLTANPTGLNAGVYTGKLRISAPSSGQTIEIPATLTVAAQPQAMLLTQTGLSFTVVSGGGVVPPQTFAVVNLGAGSMPWSAAATTLAGGSWISLSAASGASAAGASSASTNSVSVNAKDLPPGKYYGLVRIDADPAIVANTPQFVTISLLVMPPGSNPGAIVQPLELVFRATPGKGGEPGAEELQIYNPLAESLTMYSSLSGSDIPFLADFQYRPRTAIISGDRPMHMLVDGFSNYNLRIEGTIAGTLALRFSDGTVRNVKLQYIVPSEAALWADPQAGLAPRAVSSCAPTRLIPSVVAIGQGSSVPSGWPAPITVAIQDDCGENMVAGNVTAKFSNGNPPVPLTPLSDGRWQGTWNTRVGNPAKVTVTVDASDPVRKLAGSLQTSADLSASEDPPVSSADQMLSAVNPTPFQAIAPGAIIRIRGQRLAESGATAEGAPLPTTLGRARVLVAGIPAPLLSASPGELLAVVPYQITPSTRHQIVLMRGLTYSQPVSVDVAPAQPAILVRDGGLQALATILRGDAQFDNSPESPARPGDTVVLEAQGLGVVDPAVADGDAAPGVPVSTARDTPQVTVGGVTVQATAALEPGKVGFYQLWFTLPPDAPAGAAVPIAVTIGGQTSAVAGQPQPTLAIAAP